MTDAIEDVTPLAQIRGTAAQSGIPKRPLPEPKLLDVPAFNGAALLPVSLRWWIEDEANRIGGPVEFAAVTALATLGAIASPKVLVQLAANNTDYKVAITNWGACIGDPSTKKSPLIGAAMRHIKDIEKFESKAFEDELAAFEKKLKRHSTKVGIIETRIKKLLTKIDAEPANEDLPSQLESADVELSLLEAAAPERPACRQYVVNDTTVERLGMTLAHSPGVFYFRDELPGLLNVLNREDRAHERPFLLEAFNGKDGYKVERVSREDVYIDQNVLTLFGGIQPDRIMPLVQSAMDNSADNDGFMARFQLMVYPDYEYRDGQDRTPHAESFTKAAEVFQRLAMLPKMDTALTFEASAMAMFGDWRNALNHRCATDPEMHSAMKAALGKYDKLCGGLAGLFCLVAEAAEVQVEHVTRAIAWCNFLEPHAARVYGMAGTADLKAANLILSRKEHPSVKDGFSFRTITKSGWAGCTDEKVAREALEVLKDFGHLCEMDKPSSKQGGRPTTRYEWL